MMHGNTRQRAPMTLALGAVAFVAITANLEAGWLDDVLSPPPPAAETPFLKLVRQDHERLEFGRSVLRTPLKIGSRTFEHGLGTHAVSHIRVSSPEPIVRFSAWIGVDHNERTQAAQGSIVFSVWAGDRKLFESALLRGGQDPQRVDVEIPALRALDLRVSDAGDGPICDHADWADAAIATKDGRTFRLDELTRGELHVASRHPFSFRYAGTSSDALLDTWDREQHTEATDDTPSKTTTRWTDAKTGLRVTCELTRYNDFPAAEWVLFFENTGTADTPLIENVQAMDLTLRAPFTPDTPYKLYRTGGGPADPSDFEFSTAPIDSRNPQRLDPGQGRSSHKVFPFFKIETARGSTIIAIGWSGMWAVAFTSPDDRQLHMTAGLERTRFILHPGERVRSPRILILLSEEKDTWEANALFRRLLQQHYVARRAGRAPEPTLFCNTCFTRGGGWLNECNAENQISLINAYAPLGLEALLTDAGWFEGGWPAGAGNWTARKDAYPQGMAPVAAAARAKGMVYGLWFEPERVVAGTELHRKHPEWLLRSTEAAEDTYLLNFGLPQVQDYFFKIVKGFMDLPGFRFYRQDFNMDPLPYWRHSDAPDRVGITEMKYIEGLYAYWDRIASEWPDSLREECASGGNRIDLETVMRMHLHQKTDFWFNNEVDQASLWGLSQYLPNNVVVAHLNRMDDYSFHSTLPASLCMGWIADAADFDASRGKQLLDQYLSIRHLLTGSWYPLLPYSRGMREWTGSQFHRPNLDEGVLLIFRRAESPYRTVDVRLRGLNPRTTYAYTCYDSAGERMHLRARGEELMRGLQLTIPAPHRSDLIVYRRAGK